MPNPTRNVTEFSIVMRMTLATLCQQDELGSVTLRQLFNAENPCHIYFICKRPRVTIIPEKCSLDQNLLTLTFAIQNKLHFREASLTGRLDMNCASMKVISNYPHSRFEVLCNGKSVLGGSASLYYNMHLREYDTDMDLQVLYIGQSYGEGGSRMAPERLIQHSTLQKIYFEAMKHNPDHEIWIILMGFERSMITSFDGTLKNPRSPGNDDVKRAASAMTKFLNNELNEHQIINFTEAALIKYFQPSYNKEYRDTFPHPAHKSYSECYDLDINSVAFELQTDCIGTRLYSENVKPAITHLVSFTMESREKRISMFDVGDNSFDVRNLNFSVQ